MQNSLNGVSSSVSAGNQESVKTKFQKHLAVIGNELKLEYLDEGIGRPILFLHGALSNANTWRKIFPTLSKNYRCIAPDLPLGAHSIPLSKDTDLSPIGIAEIIRDFINYLNLQSIIVVANDTGGAYAQIFTSLYPETVEKLILSNCEGLDVFPPPKFAYLRYAVKIPGFCYLMSRMFSLKSLLKSNMMLGLLSVKITSDEFYNLYVKNFVENKSIRENFRRVAQTWSPKYTLEAAINLANFSSPVLILWGNKDFKLFPIELGERIKDIFPNGQLIEIENSRTYIQEDQPEHTIMEIVNFIEIDYPESGIQGTNSGKG